ncbi:MAG: HAMP domain-containing histidine kinase [Eubacterium sp.]|nr:HAMP domain-containing histidine kinase [Eubacterium sp.]
MENGKLEISNEFEYEDDGYYFLVISQKDGVIAGDYPKGFPSDVSFDNKMQKVEYDKESYFVYDRRKPHTLSEDIYIRGIVRKSDISSHYKRLEYLSYFSALAVAVVVLLAGRYFAGKIANSLRELRHVAENIGTNHDISQRITYSGNFKDISVLAEADNYMLDQMEQIFQSQEQFSSNVTHELKTPVAVIMAESRYGSSKAKTMEEMRESFEVIHRQSEKMNHLILQLLHLARMEQGLQPIEKEWVGLDDIVKSICEDEKEKSNVIFELELREVSAPMDINLIIIGLKNLISNAAKFSPPGIPVTVQTGGSKERIYMSVTDRGPGIDEEHKEQIFERFYKEDTSRQSDGFGLGLAIAMKIAQIHGGTIEVNSTPGEGSTFIFWISRE